MSIYCTTEDLIRFIYKETEQTEHIKIRNSISRDSKLKKEYVSLKHTCKCLDIIKYCPDNEIINKILANSIN